jgi:primosomal protein N'
VPAPLPRVKGHYRYHLILKGDKDRDATGKRLRRIARNALIRFHEKTHHPGVRVVVDVDPVDTL